MINSKRIREHLETHYPRLEWRVKKERNKPQFRIYASFIKDDIELGAAIIVLMETLAIDFNYIVDDIGKSFYRDLERKL